MKANEDIDVTLYCRRLLEQNEELSFGFVDDILYVWMDHKGNMTNSISNRVKRRQSIYAFDKNGYEIPEEITDLGMWKKRVRHLGSFLVPRFLKKPLEPVLVPLVGLVNRMTNGMLFPYVSSRLPDDVDLNWFKKELVS